MNNDWKHLIKITIANLPHGKLNLTADEIINAMVEAVAKESVMCQQLLSDPCKMGAFIELLTPMVYEKARK